MIWGLKIWSDLTVVRPIVTYVSMVWWTKTLEKNAQTKLQARQKLACLCITGALHFTRSAALEAMLDLLRLHLFVRWEAVLRALRTLQTKHLKSGDMVDHIKILCEILTESTTTPTDLLPIEFILGRPLKCR